MSVNLAQAVANAASSIDRSSLQPTVPRPNRASGSKMESSPASPAPMASAFPQTDVQVHLDNSTNVLIYEFHNSRSGALVYQIPSQQLLELMKAVQQQLEKLSSKTPEQSR